MIRKSTITMYSGTRKTSHTKQIAWSRIVLTREEKTDSNGGSWHRRESLCVCIMELQLLAPSMHKSKILFLSTYTALPHAATQAIRASISCSVGSARHGEKSYETGSLTQQDRPVQMHDI
jgi:hypothetical protein